MAQYVDGLNESWWVVLNLDPRSTQLIVIAPGDAAVWLAVEGCFEDTASARTSFPSSASPVSVCLSVY